MALRSLGLDVDILSPDADLSGYAVVVAPALTLISDAAGAEVHGAGGRRHQAGLRAAHGLPHPRRRDLGRGAIRPPERADRREAAPVRFAAPRPDPERQVRRGHLRRHRLGRELPAGRRKGRRLVCGRPAGRPGAGDPPGQRDGHRRSPAGTDRHGAQRTADERRHSGGVAARRRAPQPPRRKNPAAKLEPAGRSNGRGRRSRRSAFRCWTGDSGARRLSEGTHDNSVPRLILPAPSPSSPRTSPSPMAAP